MKTQFSTGEVVRVIRNVRNDGTFPGSEVGDLLVRRGTLGHVRNIGTYLQDQVIYAVHFFDQAHDIDRLVGCREEELISKQDPWTPSRFEFRDKVTCNRALAISGEIIVEPGTEGEIIKVVRHQPVEEPQRAPRDSEPHGGAASGPSAINSPSVDYHVRFPGRTLLVPEPALDPIEGADLEPLGLAGAQPIDELVDAGC